MGVYYSRGMSTSLNGDPLSSGRKRRRAAAGGGTAGSSSNREGGHNNNSSSSSRRGNSQQNLSSTLSLPLRRSLRLSCIAPSTMATADIRQVLPIIPATEQEIADGVPLSRRSRDNSIILLDDPAPQEQIIDLTEEDTVVLVDDSVHDFSISEENEPSIIDLTSPNTTEQAGPSRPSSTSRQNQHSSMSKQGSDNDVICVEGAGPSVRNPGVDLNLSITPKRAVLSCPVCMDHERTIKRTGRQFISTTCGHLFCDDCMNQILDSTKKNCPTCRKKLTKKSIHPIYI